MDFSNLVMNILLQTVGCVVIITVIVVPILGMFNEIKEIAKDD